jgi:hypothetical protein
MVDETTSTSSILINISLYLDGIKPCFKLKQSSVTIPKSPKTNKCCISCKRVCFLGNLSGACGGSLRPTIPYKSTVHPKRNHRSANRFCFWVKHFNFLPPSPPRSLSLSNHIVVPYKGRAEMTTFSRLSRFIRTIRHIQYESLAGNSRC